MGGENEELPGQYVSVGKFALEDAHRQIFQNPERTQRLGLLPGHQRLPAERLRQKGVHQTDTRHRHVQALQVHRKHPEQIARKQRKPSTHPQGGTFYLM